VFLGRWQAGVTHHADRKFHPSRDFAVIRGCTKRVSSAMGPGILNRIKIHHFGSVMNQSAPAFFFATSRQRPEKVQSRKVTKRVPMQSIAAHLRRASHAAAGDLRPNPPKACTMMLSAVASAAHPHRAAAKLGSRAPTRALRNAAVAPRRKVARQLIEATISKDNVFANNPGSLAALSAMGLNNQVPVTPNMMPFDDLASATMPHRERLKVFSGSAHPELSNVSPFSPSQKGALSPRINPAYRRTRGGLASPRALRRARKRISMRCETARDRVAAPVDARRRRRARPFTRISKIRFPNRRPFSPFG